MKKNDYLIYKSIEKNDDGLPSSDNYHLGRALRPAGEDKLVVKLEKDVHFDPSTVTIEKHQIVLPLGQNPNPGVVYGIDLSYLHRKTLPVEGANGYELHLFTELTEKQEDEASKALTRTYKKMAHHGLDFVFSALPIHTEVLQRRKKYAGLFRGGKNNSRIQLCMNPDHSLLSEYVFLHEFGHAVDYYLMRSPELKSRWLKIYMRSIKPCTMTLKEARDTFKALKSAGSLSLWKATFDEDSKGKPNLILRAIKQAHGLSASDLSTFLHSEDFETVKEVWPTTDLNSTELNPIVTEYATMNVKELFAESFAFFMQDKKLPKSVSDLMEASIASAVGMRNQVENRN